MILLADIGNTHIKWARFVDGTLSPSTRQVFVGHDCRNLLDQAWSELEPPERVMVANVVGPEVAKCVSHWVSEQWHLDAALVVSQQTAFGVMNAYIQPESLGADRWAAMIAVWNRHHQPACIVDCGTAITIDALSAQGEHLGGLISPGLDIMRKSLAMSTHAIQAKDTNAGQVSLLARATADGVAGGTLYTQVAFIDRVVSDIMAEIGEDMLCVLSGGGADRLLPLLANEFEHEPDLVLQGLAVMVGASR